MLDLTFLLLFFMLPCVFLSLHKLAKESLLNISLINGVFVSFVLFSFVGTFSLYFGLDEYNSYIGVTDKVKVFQVMVLSSISIVFFLLGVIYFRGFAWDTRAPVKFSGVYSPVNRRQLLFSFILVCISLLVLRLYLNNIPEVALFTVFSDGANAAELARSRMGNDFDGRHHWYKLFIQSISMLVSFMLFASFLIKKNRDVLIVFLVAFCVCTFSAVMAIEKAPVIYYFLGLMFVWLIVRRRSTIGFYGALKIVIFALAMLSLIAVYFVGAESLAKGFQAIFSRAFASSISPAYFYLEIFPEVVDYQYGKTISNPGGIFPYEPFNYTVYVMDYVMPQLSEKGVVGTFPTVFWGEVYVNFGWYLIPFFSFTVGVIVALLNSFILSFNPSAITVGFMVWSILFFKDLAVTGFSAFIFSVDLFVLFFVFLMFLAMGQRRRSHGFQSV